MRETKKIWKIFLVWNYDKEEEWLNEMAMNGWTLTAVGFCNYTFVKTEPGEYSIRMEMRPHDDGYMEFLRENDVEYVGRVLQWHYYRKKASLGPFELYSDIDSRIQHLDRIGKMLFWIGMGNLLIGIGNSIGPSHLGWINLLCATLLMYALGRIQGRKDELKKESILHE